MFEPRRFFDAAPAETGGYGYADDTTKVSPFNFGGNFGNAFLKKFEWIPNGGEGGAEQEALDIVFTINDVDKSYRMFPVIKAFGKNQEEITDPKAPEFKDALTDFNARIIHILHAFIDRDTLKAATSRRFNDFKEYVQFVTGLLPKNYNEIPLDIFLQFQWQPSEGKERTYLEIPKKMKYGNWLTKAIAPQQSSTWKEVRAETFDDNTRDALHYIDGAGNRHPFVKGGWFLGSPFANQVKPAGSSTAGTDSSAASATAAIPAPASTTGNASQW